MTGGGCVCSRHSNALASRCRKTSLSFIWTRTNWGVCKINETDERFIDDPLRHIKATPDAPPAILVRHDDPLSNSVQVMIYIANVVALLQRLRSERGLRTVNLYTSLPFHAIPLLASNLHPHVVDSVRFMEFRSDLREQSPTAAESYSQLFY